MDKNKPVDLLVVEATKIDGEHLPIATKLNKVETELAFELVGSGKCRLYTPELEKELKARVKSEAELQERRALSQAPAISGVSAEALAEISKSAGGITAEQLTGIVEAATAKGIEAGIKLALESAPEAPAEPGKANT